MDRAKVSDWIVLTLLWAMIVGLVMVAIWLVFGWMVESFGREVALVTTFAVAGVVLAIVLWVGSSRHTTAIWRAALSYAADTHDMNVTALRSLSAVQREDAKAHRIREQAHAQIEVASYRAALTDARQEVRREWQQVRQQETPAAATWAMVEDDAGGDDFQWSK